MKATLLDFKRISSCALHNARSLVPRLLPSGKTIGDEWVCKNPTRDDASTGSFKINLRTGRWADFATGDKGGDLVALVAYLDASSQGMAARKLSKMLGATND